MLTLSLPWPPFLWALFDFQRREGGPAALLLLVSGVIPHAHYRITPGPPACRFDSGSSRHIPEGEQRGGRCKQRETAHRTPGWLFVGPPPSEDGCTPPSCLSPFTTSTASRRLAFSFSSLSGDPPSHILVDIDVSFVAAAATDLFLFLPLGLTLRRARQPRRPPLSRHIQERSQYSTIRRPSRNREDEDKARNTRRKTHTRKKEKGKKINRRRPGCTCRRIIHVLNRTGSRSIHHTQSSNYATNRPVPPTCPSKVKQAP